MPNRKTSLAGIPLKKKMQRVPNVEILICDAGVGWGGGESLTLRSKKGLFFFSPGRERVSGSEVEINLRGRNGVQCVRLGAEWLI